MTVLYWAAAAAALVSAGQAGWELVRDRSGVLAAWVLSMTALAASLALAAADPAVLKGGSGPAAWACAGLGTLGTWAFAEVLATGNGDARRVAGMMTAPLLGGVCVALVLAGLHWAGDHGTHESGRAGLAAIGAQLTLVIYYAPGLARIAFVAQQRARLTAAFWARTAMRALAASAGAELALIMARSAAVAVGVAGMRGGEPAITAIAILQGMTVICGVGAVAVGPAAVAVSSECGSWLAYWRLLPLWAVVREAVPEVELPARPGARFGIRWRLLRRVIEIRDGEQALRPYWREDVATRALAAARSAGLGADLEQAVVEAAVIVDAAGACLRGELPSPEPVPVELVYGDAGGDLHSEVARLVLVSRAIRRSPIVRELALSGPHAPPAGGTAGPALPCWAAACPVSASLS